MGRSLQKKVGNGQDISHDKTKTESSEKSRRRRENLLKLCFKRWMNSFRWVTVSCNALMCRGLDWFLREQGLLKLILPVVATKIQVIYHEARQLWVETYPFHHWQQVERVQLWTKQNTQNTRRPAVSWWFKTRGFFQLMGWDSENDEPGGPGRLGC